VRAYADPEDTAARGWTAAVLRGERVALAPDLLFVEAANALLVLARAGRVEVTDAEGMLDEIVALPIRVLPVRGLVQAAFGIAATRGLTPYDACYLAVAEAWDAVLVTADRRLAAATVRSELLP
jgi:predicted nucleic acid-binding protein